MTYQVLARKFRPKDFTSFIAQEHVVRALTNALDAKRLHHAYLFTGTRGVGKTTLSRIFSKAINCEEGITSKPCSVCQSCQEIDEGRFIDYLEMDAASNRGVEEMTKLLEHAVYTPVNARFKVYMIDEAHMLTNHAFNAMLKILEEPPSHLKFILATTDPQKIPVTVLSRFLQFNLKQIPAACIVSYLQNVLSNERITFEIQALRLIARAAQGSMRDALSLTDQAIAYSMNDITEDAVMNMLGAIDKKYIVRIIDILAAGKAPALLSITDEIVLRSLSLSTVLQDLASMLHRIAWAQYVPNSVLDEWPEADDLRRLANVLNPEQVQLFYQIAIIGRAELGLAPDEYAGFSITLLRMLAFESTDSGIRIEAHGTTSTPAVPSIHSSGISLIDSDKLDQSTQTIESFCKNKNEINFESLPKLQELSAHKSTSIPDQYFKTPVETSLCTSSISIPLNMLDVSEENLSQLNKRNNMEITLESCTTLPCSVNRHQLDANQEILNDPFVQKIINEFDAKIVDGSVQLLTGLTEFHHSGLKNISM